MGIDFYSMHASPPSLMVHMVAKILGLETNVILADYMKNDHLKPEFLKINPQHTCPTIVDNGFILWESRAIVTYLMNKYAKDDTLYPKDPQARALVDQRLYFDIGTLYAHYGDYLFPYVFGNDSLDPSKLEKLKETMSLLELLLEGKNWIAGSNLTLADISIGVTISCIAYTISDFNLSKYSNITRWHKKFKESLLGYNDLEKFYLETLKTYVLEKSNKK